MDVLTFCCWLFTIKFLRFVFQMWMSVKKMRLCVRTDDASTLSGRLGANVTPDTDTNRAPTRVLIPLYL